MLATLVTALKHDKPYSSAYICQRALVVTFRPSAGGAPTAGGSAKPLLPVSLETGMGIQITIMIAIMVILIILIAMLFRLTSIIVTILVSTAYSSVAWGFRASRLYSWPDQGWLKRP